MTTLTIKVTEKLKVKADKLILKICVVNESSEYKIAHDEGKGKTAEVLRRLESLVSKDSFSVSSLDVSPLYKSVEETSAFGKRKEFGRVLSGYRFTSVIMVTLSSDSDVASKLCTDLLSKDKLVADISHYYSWENLDQHSDELTTKVIRTATHKAEVMAEELRLKVLGVASITNLDTVVPVNYSNSVDRCAYTSDDYDGDFDNATVSSYLFTKDSIPETEISDSLSFNFNLGKGVD